MEVTVNGWKRPRTCQLMAIWNGIETQTFLETVAYLQSDILYLKRSFSFGFLPDIHVTVGRSHPNRASRTAILRGSGLRLGKGRDS